MYNALKGSTGDLCHPHTLFLFSYLYAHSPFPPQCLINRLPLVPNKQTKLTGCCRLVIVFVCLEIPCHKKNAHFSLRALPSKYASHEACPS